MICLSRDRVAEIFRYLEGHYPHEACGYLLGRLGDPDRVTGIRPMRNVNTERAHDRYVMDPREQLAATKEARAAGVSLIRVFHSHPDHPAKPSGTDLEIAQPVYTYMIVSVREGGAAEWTCWILDESARAFVPRVVQLVDTVE
ncbi:MAG: M67 family metallopeptidase [bacterium]